jgi:TetR/AcrR family transcriptional regulator, copper-responsive repressor
MIGPEKTARPRGRPRAFDEDVVLDRALETFWDKGYEATSIDDLVGATNLARASLYAAFSDKQGLYLRTLRRFGERMEAAFQKALGRPRPLADTLAAFYLAAIAVYYTDKTPRGCLVMCTAPSAADDPAIRNALVATLGQIQAALRSVIEEARSEGDVHKGADSAVLAELAAATLHSIALRARAREPRNRLETFARHAAASIASLAASGDKRGR